MSDELERVRKALLMWTNEKDVAIAALDTHIAQDKERELEREWWRTENSRYRRELKEREAELERFRVERQQDIEERVRLQSQLKEREAELGRLEMYESEKMTALQAQLKEREAAFQRQKNKRKVADRARRDNAAGLEELREAVRAELPTFTPAAQDRLRRLLDPVREDR